MYPSDWTVLPVDPCDSVTLDAIADLSDDQLAALVDATLDDPPDDRATETAATEARDDAPDCRHHAPVPSIPAHHITAYP